MKLCTAPAFSLLTAKALSPAVRPWCMCRGTGLRVTSGCRPLGTRDRLWCACVHPSACAGDARGCARVPEHGVLLPLCTITGRCR